jgi:hypothetical protein
MSGIQYTPQIQGQVYAWSNINISFLNGVAIGVTNISYSDAQEIEDVYGAGVNPVGRGFGNYTAEATVTLYMEELESIKLIAPNGRLQDIPEFNIIVAYTPDAAAKVVTHKLNNCRFKNNGRTVAQNDKMIEFECELIVSDITWDA